MNKVTALLLLSFLVGCATLDNSPPEYIFEAWKNPVKTIPQVRMDMQACGYKETALANDLDAKEITIAETCMKSNGYTLDTSSYKPNNCYGPKSPYLCNKLWGGKKPVSVPVRKY